MGLPVRVLPGPAEEATKNALIMPFIAALGYDVFNPQEVVPEFVADVGTKKGEKVDYATMRDGEVILLIECKKAQTDLKQAEMSQLYRYFSVTKARIAILQERDPNPHREGRGHLRPRGAAHRDRAELRARHAATKPDHPHQPVVPLSRTAESAAQPRDGPDDSSGPPVASSGGPC